MKFSGVRSWYQSGPRRRILNVTIAVVLVLGVMVVVSAFVAALRLTEFYLIGAEGLAERYPREVAPDEAIPLPIGVTNREGASRRYRVVITLKGNPRAETAWFTLADGAAWEQLLSPSIRDAGDDQEVVLLLFADGRSEPYRQLHLWLNVRPIPSR